MDEKNIPQKIQGRSTKLDIEAGFVPPKLPVTTAKIRPTSPPPKKGTDKKDK